MSLRVTLIDAPLPLTVVAFADRDPQSAIRNPRNKRVVRTADRGQRSASL
jgi:hypothetical protein